MLLVTYSHPLRLSTFGLRSAVTTGPGNDDGPVNAIVYVALVIWCTMLSTIDIRTRHLPDALTLPGAAAVLAAAVPTGHGVPACGGALLLAAPYLLVHLIAPTACGAGDVKLALGTGAAAACGGAQCWVWAAIGAPLLTALAGAGILAAARFSAWTGIVPRPVPDIGEPPARVREPPRKPGPWAAHRTAPDFSARIWARIGRADQGRSVIVTTPLGARSGLSDRRCARSVLAAPITVPHGPAMCLATVAALWPTV